jgi:hypothetical protein
MPAAFRIFGAGLVHLKSRALYPAEALRNPKLASAILLEW